MNFSRQMAARRASQAGAFSLMECLVYLAIFFVVVGVALTAFYQMNDQSRAITRNSADIVRATQAGERWRQDVRAATNATTHPANGELRLETPGGEISYFFRDHAVWRQGPKDTVSIPALADVKVSVMAPDARTRVTAWRWEVELQSKRTNATLRPLFSFQAVPAGDIKR